MARALRLEKPGGRYHLTARGSERKSIYRDDSDRAHFLELLSEATERFGLRIHAYVLTRAALSTSGGAKSDFLSIAFAKKGTRQNHRGKIMRP